MFEIGYFDVYDGGKEIGFARLIVGITYKKSDDLLNSYKKTLSITYGRFVTHPETGRCQFVPEVPDEFIDITHRRDLRWIHDGAEWDINIVRMLVP